MSIAGVQPLATSEQVGERIKELDKNFTNYKSAVKECLKRQRESIKKIVDVLTSADVDDYQKTFLESKVNKLCEAANNNDLNVLFVTMNFNWNYLDPSLLDLLVTEFDLEVKPQMEAYKSELKQFRMQTPLALFCQVGKRKRLRSSADFDAMVAEFDWPNDVTLEVVEQFRQQCASYYNLRECAMALFSSKTYLFVVYKL